MTDLVMLPPDELVPLLASRDPNDRRMAIYELEKTGDKRYASDIGALLTDPSHYVRMAAARALGEFGDTGYVDNLIAALDDDYYMVVQNAVWALAKLGAASEKALPRLQAMTESDTVLRERQLSVAEVAELAVNMIELEVEEKREREEAEKQRKAAQKAASTAAAPAAEAGDEVAAPAAAAAPITREENRPDKRTETLNRKRARAEAAGKETDWIPSE